VAPLTELPHVWQVTASTLSAEQSSTPLGPQDSPSDQIHVRKEAAPNPKEKLPSTSNKDLRPMVRVPEW